jgi:hypothetical protein
MKISFRSIAFSLATLFVLTVPQISLAAATATDWRALICIGSCGTGSVGYVSGGNPYGLPGGSVYGIVGNVVGWLLGLMALFGLLAFVLSGVMYLLSAGDEKAVGNAKNIAKYGVIGITVGLIGYVVSKAVYFLLTGVAGNY